MQQSNQMNQQYANQPPAHQVQPHVPLKHREDSIAMREQALSLLLGEVDDLENGTAQRQNLQLKKQ